MATKPQAVAHSWLKLETGHHTDPVVALAASADGQSVVSAGDCSVRVWDMASGKPRRQLLGHTGTRFEGGSGHGMIETLALSPDGQWVVTHKLHEGHGRIEVFNVSTGNLVSAFEGDARTRFQGPAFSPDGQWLALGVKRLRQGGRCVGAVQLIATRRLVRAGFDRRPAPDAELVLTHSMGEQWLPPLHLVPRWIPEPWTTVPPATRQTVQRGRAAAPLRLVVATHAAAANPQHGLHWLAFRAGRGLARVRSIALPTRIDARTLAVSAGMVAVGADVDAAAPADPPDRPPLGRLIVHDHQGRALGEALVERPPRSMAFSPRGDELAVGLDSHPVGGLHTVLCHVLTVGPKGLEQRSTYYGHDGPVDAVVWLGPDRVLSAGGDNHALHLWSPRTRTASLERALRGVGQELFEPGIDEHERLAFSAVTERQRPPNHATRQQLFDLRQLRLSTASLIEPDTARRDHARWKLDCEGQQVLQLYHRPDLEGQGTSLYAASGWPQPSKAGDLSLFVGADDHWVLWTRSGYYATNAPEQARIGYCVDRGPRREALFVPADRMAAFAREDIVRAVVEHGSEERARSQGMVIPPVDVASLLPPVVEIERVTVSANRRQARLHFRVEPLSPAHQPTRVWVLRNERYAWFESDPQALGRRQWRVDIRLNPGRNRLRLHAEAGAQVRAVPCEIEVQGPTPATAGVQQETDRPSRLYLLSVGVADFLAAHTGQAGTTEPLAYPGRDATAVFNTLACSRRSARHDPSAPLRNDAFEAVEAALLVNEQATKAAILGRIRDFADRITARERRAGAERDVLLVFLAGHGTRFSGEPELYFWNWDLIPTGADMERTGLSFVEFAEIATAVPAEVVFIIDACHSGMAGNNLMRGLDPEELARRIHAVHERGLYVVAAARSEQHSMEVDALRHGVLTSAVLGALQDRRFAAGPERRVSMFALMAAVQALMPQISAEAGAPVQTPVCRLYGDLLPLTIYQLPNPSRQSTRLHEPPASASVADIAASPPRRRRTPMATKTAPAKTSTPAKKTAPAKKVVSTKTVPSKKPAPAKQAPPARKAVAAEPAAPAKKKAAPSKSGSRPRPGADVVRS